MCRRVEAISRAIRQQLRVFYQPAPFSGACSAALYGRAAREKTLKAWSSKTPYLRPTGLTQHPTNPLRPSTSEDDPAPKEKTKKKTQKKSQQRKKKSENGTSQLVLEDPRDQKLPKKPDPAWCLPHSVQSIQFHNAKIIQKKKNPECNHRPE